MDAAVFHQKVDLFSVATQGFLPIISKQQAYLYY
jgi:hypothetical protein